MFTLTVTDHVRLDSEHVARNYTVHAHAAERLVGFALGMRLAVLGLLVFATAATVADLVYQSGADRVIAVIGTGGALVVFAVYAVLGLEARVAAHRSFAGRLWLLSERYRALMTEVQEGIVERAVLLKRRDELITQLHGVYEQGFASDQQGYEEVRLPVLNA